MNLVEYNERNIITLSEDTKWVLVAEDIDSISASITQTFLEDKEIPCFMVNQMDRSFTVMLGKNCVIKIYVPLDVYQQAYELLDTNLLTTDSDIKIENI